MTFRLVIVLVRGFTQLLLVQFLHIRYSLYIRTIRTILDLLNLQYLILLYLNDILFLLMTLNHMLVKLSFVYDHLLIIHNIFCLFLNPQIKSVKGMKAHIILTWDQHQMLQASAKWWRKGVISWTPLKQKMNALFINLYYNYYICLWQIWTDWKCH